MLVALNKKSKKRNTVPDFHLPLFLAYFTEHFLYSDYFGLFMSLFISSCLQALKNKCC